MTNQRKNYDKLEQFDFSDGEYLEKVINKYSSLIGLFLVKFNCLEQEINLAIADFLNDDCHEMGFLIIEKLMIKNKIELFYKMYVRLESFRNKKDKKILDEIKKQLKSLNSFRNSVVHANWESLTKDSFVRTKIIVDNQEGYVKFKKIKITPKIIRQKIKEIEKLINQIDKYKETAFQM